MAVHLEFMAAGPPVSNQQSTPSGRANLATWRATLAGAAKIHWTHPLLTVELKATVVNFYIGNKPSVDLDNMSKPILDVMQNIVYEDDRQIVQAELTHVRIDAPFSVVGVRPGIVSALQAGKQFVYVRIEDAVLPSRCQGKTMNIEQPLNRVVESYRTLGFKVIVQPKPEDLPAFAKDFKVEILATSPTTNVLASAKGSPAELAADPSVATYVEVTNQQPGWRFDVFVLGPATPLQSDKGDAKELSDEDIRKHLDDVEQMLHAGFVAPSLIAGWAALEAAMRRRMRAVGESPGWGTSPRTLLNELYSNGLISTSTLRRLEGLSHLRNAVAHGFSAPVVVEPTEVEFLVNTARLLLMEGQPVKQIA